jgi:hypothetical protein
VAMFHTSPSFFAQSLGFCFESDMLSAMPLRNMECFELYLEIESKSDFVRGVSTLSERLLYKRAAFSSKILRQLMYLAILWIFHFWHLRLLLF